MKLLLSQLKTIITGFSKVVPRAAQGKEQYIYIESKQVKTPGDNIQITLRVPGLTHCFLCPAEQGSTAFSGAVALEDLKPLTKLKTKSLEFSDPCNGLLLCTARNGDTVVKRHEILWRTDGARELANSDEDLQYKSVPGFIESYRQLAPITCRDKSREALSGVLISPDGGRGKIVASDGRRLCELLLDLGEVTDGDIIIPNDQFLVWPRLKGEAHLAVPTDRVGQKWIHVRVGEWERSLEVINAAYPDHQAVMPTGSRSNVIHISEDDSKALQDALKAMPSQVGQPTPALLMACGDHISVWAKSEDGKDWSELIKLKGSSSDTGIPTALDRRYLLDALKGGFRELSYDNELSPVRFDSEQGTHVIMPLRMDSLPKAFSQPEPKPVITKPIRNPQGSRKENARMIKSEDDTNEVDVGALTDALKDAQQSVQQLSAVVKQYVKSEKNRNKELAQARKVLRQLQTVEL